MIQPQHVNKRKFNKSILKASVDTVFSMTKKIVEHSNLLDKLYFSHQ